ncbi:MAG TPA: hypothetical protein VFR22_11755 [Nocardioidaceae bacterium]|nr:hypothetical protein [Nocardioidaceae bacterium]
MKRSLAVLAATAVCGGSVAVATAAYADGGGSPGDPDRGSSSDWLGGIIGSALGGDSEAKPDCRMTRLGPRNLPDPKDLLDLSDLKNLPEPPELLYSEQVVKDPDTGEFRHEDLQSGNVVDVSDDTLTVESADGTTWDWTLSDDTEVHHGLSAEGSTDDLQTGDKVLVHGTRDGDVRRAEDVMDPAPEFPDFQERADGLRAHPGDLPKQLPRLLTCTGGDARSGTGDGTASESGFPTI